MNEDKLTQESTLNEIRALKAQIQELTEWKQQKERQQLTMPLDVASMKVLIEAFRNVVIERLLVRDIIFVATQESPTEEGQMRFFNNRTTQNFRVCTTKGIFTGSIDLTAV